jgi:succinate dehydrogenase/fumarate reductase flavoprotein subunit
MDIIKSKIIEAMTTHVDETGIRVDYQEINQIISHLFTFGELASSVH